MRPVKTLISMPIHLLLILTLSSLLTFTTIKLGRLLRGLDLSNAVMTKYLSLLPKAQSKWNRELGILVSLVMEWGTAKENKCGKITHCIKDFGLMMNRVGEEGWSVRMEMFIKVISRMENSMVKVFLLVLMVPPILVSGLMTFNKGLAFSKKLTDLYTKESL